MRTLYTIYRREASTGYSDSSSTYIWWKAQEWHTEAVRLGMEVYIRQTLTK